MKNAWASLGALTLSTAAASVLIYFFQMASVGVGLLFSSPFERTVGFRVGIFLGIAVLGLAQFALLRATRIHKLSLEGISFEVMAGRRPRYLAAISTAFLASLLSMAMGLALGGEAPSSYMGGAIFSAVHFLSFQRDPSRGSPEAEEALTLGAGVGFGLAFQNPLAGALLSLGDDP